MPLVDLNDSNFDELSDCYELVIYDFWAPWCGPCQAFAPVFKASAEKHLDILFARINTEAEPTLAKQFDIFSVPMLIAAKSGVMVYARPGALSPENLEKMVADLRAS